MIPTSKEIALQIAVTHEMYPKETISQLANRLMYSPIFVINALEEGEKMELFARGGKDNEELKTVNGLNYEMIAGNEFGQENLRIQDEILRVITSANHDKMDVEDGTLMLWLRGIRPNDIEIALHVLKKLNYIVEYELTNPKDEDTKYKFYTLRINEGKEWGAKQFKETKKDK